MAIKKSKRLLSILLVVVMVFSINVAFPDTVNAASPVTPTIAAGTSHPLVLTSDGIVLAWGNNNCGQLGRGTTGGYFDSPAQTIDISNIVAVSGGLGHSLALKSDGSVWAWGANEVGQLGYGVSGSATDKDRPVKVLNLDNVIAVAGGYNHSLALKSNGTVWAWGRNNSGQLGNGTTGTAIVSPLQVNELTNVAAIAGGQNHSLALKSDGTVWTWGRNEYGQLGVGTLAGFSFVPVQVTAISGVIAIARGYSHSLALKSDGTVWAWGQNDYGQLGIGTSGSAVSKNIPVQVTELCDVIAIAGGYGHSLALKSDGTVWAWGRNGSGQLGDGTYVGKSKPVQVSGLTGVCAIAGAGNYSLALEGNGNVQAWGQNDLGQLGYGTIGSSKSSPVQVIGAGGAPYLDLGETHRVSLDLNGGDFGIPYVLVAPGAVMPRIIPPTRAGYSFNGYWNTSGVSAGKQYYNAAGLSTNNWDGIGDATLWARWTVIKSGDKNGGDKTGSTVKAVSVKTLPAIYIVKGKSVKLPAAVQPYNAVNKKVTFKSKNKKIAKVSSTGKVKGQKIGKTTITITTKDGNKKATCKVYVVKKAVKLKKLTLNQKSKVNLKKGKTLQIKPKLSPAKATGIVPKFTSGNTSVAVIDKAGTITALKAGSTTITVKAGKLKKTIKLTVK